MPARIPITTAEFGLTNAQGAVMATSPASIPLQAIEISGLPNIKYQKIIAAAEAATAARLVFTAITEIRRSDDPRVEPGLNPIQTNKRMKVPITTKAILCAGKGRGFLSGTYLTIMGANITTRAH